MTMRKLTPRQQDVLAYLKRAQVVGSGYDRSVLAALAKKGLVIQRRLGHATTWTLSRAAENAGVTSK